MTSEVGPAWRARYPDLVGKVAVVTGDDAAVPEIVAALGASGCAVAVVAADRATIDAATAAAEATGVAVFAVVADPADAQTWTRVVAHSEQRLGPLDVLVAAGSRPSRSAAIAAIRPDMAARRRGVVVEAGPGEPAGRIDGVRHRVVSGGAGADVAAAVALCASDVLAAPTVVIEVGSVD